MRVLLLCLVLVAPAGALADGWRPGCSPEKSELVRQAIRRGAPLDDPKTVQGDEPAELLYLLLASERFRETGDVLPNLPFVLSSPFNRAAHQAYDDYVGGVDMHASLIHLRESHEELAHFALIAIRGRMLPPESVALLKAGGYQPEFLGYGPIEQYVLLREKEPLGLEQRVRFLLDRRQPTITTNVVHLRLAELMPESLAEAERFVDEFKNTPVLRTLPAWSFLYLVGSKKHAEIPLLESEQPAVRAYKRLLKRPELRPCFMDRGYVFSSFFVR